jgi:hypothetical protein
MPPAPPNAPEPGLFDELSARLRAEGRAFSDAVFGTRTTTVGAVLQRPRKAALRVEPKTYFGEGIAVSREAEKGGRERKRRTGVVALFQVG